MKTKLLALIVLLIAAAPALADEREDLLVLRNTVINMLQALVQKGVIASEDAQTLVREAQDKAHAEVAEAAASEDESAVRVTYVPEVVKEEIRSDVKADLHDEVVNDVIEHAREERWGVADALPEWIGRVSWSGDVRLRGQYDAFDDGNAVNVYRDFQAINEAGGEGAAGADAFLNTTEDRSRLRTRVRVGMQAKVSEHVEAGVRLAAGDVHDIVSTNETLATTNGRYTAAFDEVYVRFHGTETDGKPWYDMTGGRIPNPWLSTSLVYDEDLRFEGVAGSYRPGFGGLGERRNLALTFGAFPLQEIELSSQDKWLLGTQLGGDLRFGSGGRLALALAYYDYVNTVGQRNAPDSNLLDFTAPDFVQRGNTLFDIRNDTDPDTNLFALAADYKLIDLTGQLDLARFDPVTVRLNFDWVRNIGYDEDDVFARTGTRVDARTDGYLLGFTVGSTSVSKANDWRIFCNFRHLERDAVLDAFTDSDFHLGGTDAEGFVLGGDYGITDHTALRMSWLSADEIDGPPLGVDLLQIDLNARF